MDIHSRSNHYIQTNGKACSIVALNDYVTKALLIGVFIICLISFAIELGSNYSKTSSDMVGTTINIRTIESSINNTNTMARAWKTAFESDSPLISLGILAVRSLWNTGIAMINVVLTLINLYLFTISNVLGIPTVVTGVITTIFIMGLIAMTYQWVRT